MTKSQLRSRLIMIISNLDGIICSQTEQTPGLPSVRKCRNDLQRVVVKLNTRGKVVNKQEVLSRIFRLIDCVHFFIFGKN